MSAEKPPPGLVPTDYDDIEAAVMETARGRWFMREFARRMRAAETQQLAELVARLEGMLAVGLPPHPEIADEGPGARLMNGRLQDIAERLFTLSAELRAVGVAGALSSALEAEARALAALGGGEAALAPPLAAAALAAPEPEAAAPEFAAFAQPRPSPRPLTSASISAIEALAQLSGQEQATLTA